MNHNRHRPINKRAGKLIRMDPIISAGLQQPPRYAQTPTAQWRMDTQRHTYGDDARQAIQARKETAWIPNKYKDF